jgi:hypothetical protein
VTLFGKIIDVLVKGFLTENRALLKVKFSNSPKIRIHFSVTMIFSENERAFSVKFRSSHKKALHVDPICDAAPTIIIASHHHHHHYYISVVDRVDRALQKIDSPEVTAAAVAAAVAAATTDGVTAATADGVAAATADGVAATSGSQEAQTEPPDVANDTTSDTSKRKRKKKRDQLVWERKGNLTSLTRIKDEMKMYGSPRDNLYEGNFRGEGVIRELKPAVPTIHRKNWSKNGIAEVHMCRTVNILEPEIASPPRRYNNFNSFKDREELVKSLDEGKVVSGVVFEERLLAVIEGKQGTEYFELCFDDNNTDASIMASACWFAPAKPALTAWKIKEEKLKEYFVILPREKRAPTVAPSYYAITSEWRERLRDGSICFPRSVGATY